MSKAFNKKVFPSEFQVGDLVLHENPNNQQNRDQKGKFESMTWTLHYYNDFWVRCLFTVYSRGRAAP